MRGWKWDSEVKCWECTECSWLGRPFNDDAEEPPQLPNGCENCGQGGYETKSVPARKGKGFSPISHVQKRWVKVAGSVH